MPIKSDTVQPVFAAEDRFSALLDAAVDAIVLINRRGEITLFNHAAERLLGYQPAEVLGRNVSMLMPEPYQTEHDRYIQHYLTTGQRKIIGIGREVVARRKDGTSFPIELSVGEYHPTRQGFGRRSSDDIEHGFVGILRDITERKQLEAQLRKGSEELKNMLDNLGQSTREAEELRARLTHVGRIGTLGEMVSGIAHEVNQPLTAIANYANACRRLLTSGQAKPAELVSTLEKISDQADRAGQVIRGLRSLVRKRDVVRESLDCNQLVRDVARLVDFELRQAGFRLVWNLASSVPRVMGDGVQIQQVVLNLFRNGLDAMLEWAQGDSIELATRVSDGWVEISINDCGPGLSAQTVERLYEPFFTTKPQGIGLGLSICKSIVQAHDGELNHAALEGGGTSFTIRLPFCEG